MYAIIGNLLDNAIEENKRLPKESRFLHIYIGQKNTQFYLVFTNEAGKKRDKRRSIFPSAKGAQHGLGLVRVESLVKKYGGLFSADSEDGRFTAELLIRCYSFGSGSVMPFISCRNMCSL